MIDSKSYKFKGANDRLITADLTYSKYEGSVPICVFVHGFKGFKDWGAWPLAAQIFAVKGIPFFKFNFSHNGTSPENLTDFVDLEAFGHNTISKELEDLDRVFSFIEQKSDNWPFSWNGDLFILGHSRGGTVSILKALNDKRISKIATWNAPSSLKSYLEVDTDQWLKDGVRYIKNTRTGVDMPMYVHFYLDLIENTSSFNILNQIEEMEQDLLIIHSEDDETVKNEEGLELYSHVQHAIFVPIEKADHVFNIKHPLTEKKISLAFATAVDETIEFFLM